jgi:hypothetical protein
MTVRCGCVAATPQPPKVWRPLPGVSSCERCQQLRSRALVSGLELPGVALCCQLCRGAAAAHAVATQAPRTPTCMGWSCWGVGGELLLL